MVKTQIRLIKNSMRTSKSKIVSQKAQPQKQIASDLDQMEVMLRVLAKVLVGADEINEAEGEVVAMLFKPDKKAVSSD